MKKLLLILILLITTNVYGAPPTRDNTYTSGDLIRAADVTANEDAIFNYLSAGVDTYADGTIVNADVNSSAAIQSDKLTLTSIAQDVAITSAGSFDNNGTSQFDGTVTIAAALTCSAAATFSGDVTLGDGTDDTLTINSDDGITFTPAATWTFTGAQTVSGTWTDLGTVTTANIDGGTLDGVQIGGATTTGTIFYNDASDNTVGLVPGADGTVLTSTGTSGIPAYESGTGLKFLSVTALSTDTSHNTAITIEDEKQYRVIVDGIAVTAGIEDFAIRIGAGTSGYQWYNSMSEFTATPNANIGVVADDSDAEIHFWQGQDVAVNQFIQLEFILSTQDRGAYDSWVSGTGFWQDEALGTSALSQFQGMGATNTPTEFTFGWVGAGSPTFTADIYVYEYILL